jgi:hypothetical protein
MNVKKLYEESKNAWPADETLDNWEMDVAQVYAEDGIQEDIKKIEDWIERVKKNYPELYVSQESNIKGKKS